MNFNDVTSYLDNKLDSLKRITSGLAIADGRVGRKIEVRGEPLPKQRELTGIIPLDNLNPGNVKVKGIADSLAKKNPDGTPTTDKFGHLVFDNEDRGIEAFRLDLGQKVKGESKTVPQYATLEKLAETYAADQNWLAGVLSILKENTKRNITPKTLLNDIGVSDLMDAIARQEGYLQKGQKFPKKPIPMNSGFIQQKQGVYE